MQADFKRDMAWSHAQLTNDELLRILKPRFPHCTGLKRSSDSEDRAGTDFWLTRQTGNPISIDVKFRTRDCRQFGTDDLCIELQSGRVTGWAMDRAKATDYVVWCWADTGRTFIVPFAQLLSITAMHADQWRKTYGVKMVPNKTYQTECCFVPLVEFERASSAWNHGFI